MSTTTDYGNYYYCVDTTDGRRLYVMADRVEVTPDGGLVFLGHQRDQSTVPVLGLARGAWLKFFAASMLDGRGVAIEQDYRREEEGGPA